MERDVVNVSYRYLIQQEIDGSDQGHLIDALEDEVFPIREILGEDAMNEQIREGMIELDHESEKKLAWFGDVMRTLSVYVSEYIYGLEFAAGFDDRDVRVTVEILKYVGRRGDLIAVPLDHSIEFPSGEITPQSENLEYLRNNWNALPRWAQDGYRLKFPELRVL